MKKKTNTAIKVGAGIAAVSALAVGAYMLYGKNGAKNRKKLKSWMLKAKGEVLEKLEKAEKMSAEKYHGVVDAVAAKYHKMAANRAEVVELVNELKSYAKSAKSAVKKTVKKVAKRSKKAKR